MNGGRRISSDESGTEAGKGRVGKIELASWAEGIVGPLDRIADSLNCSGSQNNT